MAQLVPRGTLDLDVAADLGSTACFARTVANHLREVGCPFLAEAMVEQAKGTLVTMADAGAVTVKEIDRGLAEVKHKGDDNYKTWDEYLDRVRGALKKEIVEFEVGGACLEVAMESLAHHIHHEHWEAFGEFRTIDGKDKWVGTWPLPRGPDGVPTGMQETNISIRLDQSYPHGHLFVYVVMGGEMMVQDDRPSEKCFVAKVWGKPQIKYLTVDPTKLKTLENLAATDKQAFLTEMAEAAGDYGESKPLTLADLKKMRAQR